MEIEEVIHYVQMILNRKLTDVEILAVGLSYQQGILEGSRNPVKFDHDDV